MPKVSKARALGAQDEPVVFNYSAGPAVLPAPVMRRAQAELLDYAGSGLSIMETGHRTPGFGEIVERAESDLRALYNLPEDYAVLFLQGGASLQFLMVAMNLARPGAPTAYVDSGYWSAKAIAAAREVRSVKVVASAATMRYRAVPQRSQWADFSAAAYLHYTPNETIHGVEFDYIPETDDVALVADMSSCILSRPLPIRRFGLIYAGAQKNLGPTGLAVVILRRDLAERAAAETPALLRYRDQIVAGSMLNTPPTFTWYVIGLVLAWVREQGGLEEMARRAAARSRIVYATIDASGGFYRNPVDPPVRSRMNIPFHLHDERLEAKFLREAEAAGLKQLAGHRVVGGLRASLYNAMPLAGAEALAGFMREFARHNG